MAVRALGGRPGRGARPRRLTRSAPGESSPAWAPDGSLLFTSARPDPAAKENGDPKPALWSLPRRRRRGPPRPDPAGGIGAFAVAPESGDVVVSAATMPGGSEAEADEERRKQRKDAGVSAILHEIYPVRYWDHDLGPAVPHAVLGRAAAPGGAGRRRRARRAPRPDARRRPAGRCR